jgi:hypothetical protein
MSNEARQEQKRYAVLSKLETQLTAHDRHVIEMNYYIDKLRDEL